MYGKLMIFFHAASSLLLYHSTNVRNKKKPFALKGFFG
jgi:hypothetical protein